MNSRDDQHPWHHALVRAVGAALPLAPALTAAVLLVLEGRSRAVDVLSRAEFARLAAHARFGPAPRFDGCAVSSATRAGASARVTTRCRVEVAPVTLRWSQTVVLGSGPQRVAWEGYSLDHEGVRHFPRLEAPGVCAQVPDRGAGGRGAPKLEVARGEGAVLIRCVRPRGGDAPLWEVGFRARARRRWWPPAFAGAALAVPLAAAAWWRRVRPRRPGGGPAEDGEGAADATFSSRLRARAAWALGALACALVAAAHALR